MDGTTKVEKKSKTTRKIKQGSLLVARDSGLYSSAFFIFKNTLSNGLPKFVKKDEAFIYLDKLANGNVHILYGIEKKTYFWIEDKYIPEFKVCRNGK